MEGLSLLGVPDAAIAISQHYQTMTDNLLQDVNKSLDNFEIKRIDLLSMENVDAIAHQCNCISKGHKGLYSAIIKKYPHAHVYSQRDKPDIPGTIKVTGDHPKVIAMFGQYKPGVHGPDDSAEQRIEWFKLCLEDIKKLELKSIAFPFGIGCGLAGGNWKEYFKMLIQFAISNPNTFVTVCMV